jgi:predicted outer membrane lipoprotein
MAVITFCVSLPALITGIPVACAGAVITGLAERAIARKILAAKILASCLIVFSPWRHQ